jgi:dihydrofolate reductase
MSKFRFHLSVSADGYAAGPNQSEENPLGEGGEELHEWAFPLAAWREPHGREGGEVNASGPVVEEMRANVGAGVMGRNMFGPIAGGDWGDGSWKGWWGENPPFHHPVFVLTHHEREPLEMEGDTTFIFVTDGIESALEQARDAAGEQDVQLHGGASVAQQYLAAGLVDEFEVSIVPIMLGGGERLLDNIGPDLKLEQVRTIDAPGVTHVKYRVVK